MTRMGRAAWHVRLTQSEAVRDEAALLLVCAWCLLVTRTSVGLAQRVRSLGQLPPFEIDPSAFVCRLGLRCWGEGQRLVDDRAAGWGILLGGAG